MMKALSRRQWGRSSQRMRRARSILCSMSAALCSTVSRRDPLVLLSVLLALRFLRPEPSAVAVILRDDFEMEIYSLVYNECEVFDVKAVSLCCARLKFIMSRCG